jgi:hypothetical protein
MRSVQNTPRSMVVLDGAGLGGLLSSCGEGEGLMTARGGAGGSTPASVAGGGREERGSGQMGVGGGGASLLGLPRIRSQPRGIADSMEGMPAFETPSRWPGMQGGLKLQGNRLSLQLRITQNKAAADTTYWSGALGTDGRARHTPWQACMLSWRPAHVVAASHPEIGPF